MIVYLNGKYLPLESAYISPLDRGFLFGDGVYEVIPAFASRLFRGSQHLDRLQSSLDAIRLQNPHSESEWIAILNRLMAKQPFDNHSIYLQITRGVDTKRDHTMPDGISPTVFAMSTEIIQPPADLDTKGICAITQPDSRWTHCDIKAITLLSNILHKQQAVDANCTEALMIRDGKVIEGSASNIFVIKAGEIRTPPKSQFLLPGITRDLVLELAEENHIPAYETDIVEDELFAADEVWVSSSTREILPVVTIDQKPIGDGRPGKLWKQMRQLYQDYKGELIAGVR
ncbi:MAG: D-amino acid aminotransferase [Gammaproteobacteria bacterium]|nr:MAG: D-amino acid aminotransferase [Gammaproteobacteria bacterium]